MRLKVQVLANETIRLDIPIFNHVTAIRILVQPEPPRRVCDVLVLNLPMAKARGF